MKINVNELTSEISQVFSITRRHSLHTIGPYLYKHLSPSGTFTFSIIQNATTLGSKSFTSADIETIDGVTASNYFHGAYRLTFANPIILNPGQVTVKLTSSGYTFSESAYIGWIREHERTVNAFTDTGNDWQNPLAVEFWTYQGGDLRTLDISDGFTSGSTPSTSFPDASTFINYANSTAYEAVHGSPSGGECYYDTTDNVFKVYRNGAWRENADFE